MYTITFTSSFKRAYKKTIVGNPELKVRFWEAVDTFMHDPFDRKLRTHKLSGKLSHLYSFRITFEIRIVFYFKGSDKAIFVDIGSHDDVY